LDLRGKSIISQFESVYSPTDDRKEAKKRKKTTAIAQGEAANYRKRDTEAKKSCKQNKKDWIEFKCTEAQEAAAASRNDIRSLYGVLTNGSARSG